MNHRERRSGAVLVAALVCLLVSVSIVSTMIAGTLQRRTHLRSLHRVRQAELMVTTARNRALCQLRLDDSYDGEVWAPVLMEKPHQLNAEVTIEVLAEKGTPSRLKIAVVFPANNPRSVRRSGEFAIPDSDADRSNDKDE